MRALKYFVVVPALALLVMSCGPHHRRCGGMDGPPCKGGKHAMMMHHHGGGAGACSYRSHWFSEGAIRSNDGVCQSCSAGKWVAADGCRDHDCCGYGCGMMGKKGKKSAPCPHSGGGRGGPGPRP